MAAGMACSRAAASSLALLQLHSLVRDFAFELVVRPHSARSSQPSYPRTRVWRAR